MSQYQKEFFDENITTLEELRQTNTILVGCFTLVVGVLFVIVGGLSFKLHSELGARFVPDKKTMSRMPKIDAGY